MVNKKLNTVTWPGLCLVWPDFAWPRVIGYWILTLDYAMLDINDKKGRPWIDATFWSIWSGYTLFALVKKQEKPYNVKNMYYDVTGQYLP